MKLLVVIVNYRVTQLTIDCLRSLSSQIHDVSETHVAVCENGTGSEAIEQLRHAIDHEGWGSWITLTAISPNRGFTGGNNAVLRPAMESGDPPQYFLLLNADTVPHPGSLRRLVDFMDQHLDVGIAGSSLEYGDGSDQPNAYRFPSALNELDRGLRLACISRLLRRWELSPALPEAPTSTDWVSGASMIIRRQVFESTGLLDEDLYTYFDDIDLCLRARRLGWPTWYVPTSRVMHYDGSTTGITAQSIEPKRRPDYWFQARRVFWLKNYGAFRTALADAAWLVGLALWRVRRRIQRKPDTDPRMFLWDSIRHSVFIAGFRLQPVKNPALPD